MAPKTSTFFDLKTCLRSKTPTVGHHFFETMCPTAFLAPTLIAKTCSSALSQNMHFFWPNLRCKVIVKSRQWPKKSPKNWTGPCLSLNMVRRNRFIKWQTPARNAKSSFEGANPTPSSSMQQQRPPARTMIESKRTVRSLGSESDKTVTPGPKCWNPISSSKCIVLARQD